MRKQRSRASPSPKQHQQPAGYDSLSEAEQKHMRGVWALRVDYLRGKLDLESRFARSGYAYAECDQLGRVSVSRPKLSNR